MADEPNLPPMSLLAPVGAMLAIHAAALVASTHLTGADWPERIWGPFHVTAALVLLGLLGYVLRRANGVGDATGMGRWLLLAAGADLLASLILAWLVFG
jgi:hypothetical protein